MRTRIELVDPLDRAADASAILQAAWKPPCLYYSPEYVRWQLSFPGALPSMAAIASVDHRPAGCVALITRQFVYASSSFAGYVLSFAAVDPTVTGRGIGTALYAALLDVIPSGVPVFAFATPATAGERLLVNSFQRASFRRFQLAPCKAAGYVQVPATRGAAVSPAREASTHREFSAGHLLSPDQLTVWIDMTESQWGHYAKDPRGRRMLVIRDSEGDAAGTAMVTMGEVVSNDGVQRIPMLEAFTSATPTPEGLKSALAFAAGHSAPGSTVIASNLSYVDPQTVRAAGARTLPSTFNSYLFVKGDALAVEKAQSLTLEVI